MNKTLAYYSMVLYKDFVAYSNEKLAKIGLSQGLLFFIIYIGKHPHCSPKELAEALHMDTGHVARSLAKLEKNGFLSQECDSKDRRSHILKLLEKGEEAFRMSYELFPSWDNDTSSDLSEEEHCQLMALLERVTKPCIDRLYEI